MATVVRDEIIRKLPQKLVLTPIVVPGWIRGLWLLFALAMFLGTFFLCRERTMTFSQAAGWASLPLSSMLLIGFPAGKLFKVIAQTFQFFPCIIYDPREGRLLVHDLTGWETLINPSAKVIIDLKSLVSISVRQEPDGWFLFLAIRKGEGVTVHSSRRGSSGDAEELARRLRIMVGFPEG